MGRRDGAKVIIGGDLRLVDCLLLLFHLHRAHATEGLFSLDALLFARLQDLFVLDAELAALDLESVEGCDDGICVHGLAEVGKGEAAEGALLVEVVVEGVGGGDGQRCLSGC